MEERLTEGMCVSHRVDDIDQLFVQKISKANRKNLDQG